jgi:hypothetical protein
MVSYLECGENPRIDDGEERLRKKVKFYPTSPSVAFRFVTSHTYVSPTSHLPPKSTSLVKSIIATTSYTVHDTNVPSLCLIMSFIRARSIATLRAGRIVHPINARFFSTPADSSLKTSPSDAPTTPPKESSLIREEGPGEAMARHQPDYNATIDHATS